MGKDICTQTAIFKSGFLGGKKELVITSDFITRETPGREGKSFHYGVDLRCASGTQITCPVPSAKIFSYQIGGAGGQRLCLKYENGKSVFYIRFLHLHKCNFSVADIGKVIHSGEPLGETGGGTDDKPSIRGTYSTGPHLHLEIQYNASDSAHAIDPKCYFLAHHILKIKTQLNWNGEPYNGDGYVNGIHSFYFSDAIPSFCEEYIVSALQRGADKGAPLFANVESNNETEYPQPRRRTKYAESTERLALGIWQITKMVMDSSVQDRQIVDSSISIQTGSLQNFFNKVCQQPFVEFYGDTFGNQYYWLIRKPPFDQEGFLRLMSSASCEISEDDIISYQSQYESGNIYSWYQLVPTGDVMGVGEELFLSPAVFFPEYAAIWGSKPLSVQSLYYDFVYSGLFNANTDDERKENVNNIIRNIVRDFKYIIECNAYRPFSKMGSVTLKGRRNIKRGTLAVFEDGQVYHIDSVSHSYSTGMGTVQNTTTLQLSHGIYSKYIGEKWTQGFGDVSYFNLIDWGQNFKLEDVTADNYIDKISEWKVNKECLTFFLTKSHIQINKNELDELVVSV